MVRHVIVLVMLVGCGNKATNGPVVAEACKTDDDCAISCLSRESCCDNPYCENVTTLAEANAVRKVHARKCTKPEDYAMCPQIGSRMPVDYSFGARCRAGACVGERTPLVDA